MQISNIHGSIMVMKSIDTRFSRNVFEAVDNTRSTCFIGSKTTRLRLVVFNPIKHSCSFFKHYVEARRTPRASADATGLISFPQQSFLRSVNALLPQVTSLVLSWLIRSLFLNVHFIILHKSLFDLIMALDSSFKLKLSNSLMSST